MAEETIFGKILSGEIPSQEVYSDEEFYAFRDVNPAAPVHILIIPRKPIPKVTHLTEADAALMGRMFIAANKIAEQEGLAENGFRYVINCGEWGGQTVFHLHLHILGGRAMTWPPG
ncbi:MAG TPA: histidine triad nucleotide-binding protein [Candidatus Hydrogenedentes bacterium]|jgi:histidine triad (HIT) family protein|nr:histidine triad nucleotide-binding protein [Candidatus Hydrogenedentota bacterium]HPJ98128.1 histidine triad nucleotide-binding protein [Candidatus Hydrogenedentota bacterium]